MRKIALTEWCNKNNRQDILLEWDYLLNSETGETPDSVASNSEIKVWWICEKCANRWQSAIKNRIKGHGCPKCGHIACDSKRKISSYENSLAANYPELLAEWDYSKNIGTDPATVHYGSEIKVSWICKKCGNCWEARVSNRVHGKGCPYCAHLLVTPGVNDLQTLYPEIAVEYDETKNAIPASSVFSKSNRRVWWKCNKGHSYEASVSSRTNKNSGCPYCSGRIAITGINDIKTMYPDLAKEWDYELNIHGSPETTLPNSGKKIWWKCERGHLWKAPPYSRIKGVGCPVCNGLFQTSLPEQAILYYLSSCFNAISRSRINGFEVDIFLPDYNIGIEYDGMYYHSSGKAKKQEEKKNKALMDAGIILIHVKEDLARNDIEGNNIYYVLKPNYEALDNAIQALVSELERLTLVHCPVSVNFCRDRLTILSYYRQYEIKNSFANTKPYLLSEWDNEKNGDINPRAFSPHSNQKVWWKCPNNHSYLMSIASRAEGQDCPFCSNRKLAVGYNDLQTRFPNLAIEWHPTKNKTAPTKIIFSSSKKYWWKCFVCNYEWEATAYARTNGKGCPRCAHKKQAKAQALPSDSDASLAKMYPEIAAQWDYSKNEERSPEAVFPYSNKKKWWLCPNGHSYEMQVVKRTKRGYNCPFCSGERVLKGYNDLATLRPDLVDEWDFEQNNMTPDSVTLSSNRKVWWKCSKCGYRFSSQISNRTKINGTGCPICGIEKAANSRKKPVQNIDTGEVFQGIVDAAKKYNKSHTTLSACLAGKCKTAYGFHWKYYQEE